MRQPVIALTLIAVSTLLSFAAAEWIVRRIHLFPQPQFLTLDPVVGHRHRPNIEGYFAREGLGYVRINRHGFRDKDYALEKNDKKRLAVLGDSYTAAFHVNLEQTYHGRLEAEFEDRLEVLNFGVSGYGTAQELLTYKHFVRPFNPDIVVLSFYPGNDFKDNDKQLSDNYPRPYFTLGNTGLKLDDSFRRSSKHRRPHYVYDLYYFLTDHSIIFSLLDQLRYRKDPQQAVQQHDSVTAVPKAGSHLLYAPTSKEHLGAWLLTESLIVALAEAVENDGAEFVLLVQDSMPRQSTNIDHAYYVEQRLGRLCANHALVCGFMAPTAMAFYRSTGKSLHGFGDTDVGHWNEDGHRLAYTVLRNVLVGNHLIP